VYLFAGIRFLNKPNHIQSFEESTATYSRGTEGIGVVELHSVDLLPQGLKLESGKTLAGPITVAYEIYGTLTPEKDNAILICHALSGDAHAAGWHEGDRKPGWWDGMIGPGRAFDTDKYFVICSNLLGSCYGTTGPQSINPQTGKAYGCDFPIITIDDMVNVEVELIRHLGITKLLAVAGGSMGGMQALQWAVHYPQLIESVICVASTYRHSPQQIAFNFVAREAIESDPKWQAGHYYETENTPDHGLAVARMVGHITYLSEKSMEAKFSRALGPKGATTDKGLQYQIDDDFSVEKYLEYQGGAFVERFDANSMLYITKALDYFDLSGHHGGWMRAALVGEEVEHQALNETFAKSEIPSLHFLLMSFTSDWLYPPAHLQRVASGLRGYGMDVSYFNFDCPGGHDSFLLSDGIERQTRVVIPFLKTQLERVRGIGITQKIKSQPAPAGF